MIVHGVGSFGHVPVIKRKLYVGFRTAKQLPALSQTMIEVFDLRIAVTKALQKAGLAPVVFLPSNIILMTNSEITEYFSRGLQRYLDLGMTLLLGGDVCSDDQRGFSVCSGDKDIRIAKLVK